MDEKSLTVERRRIPSRDAAPQVLLLSLGLPDESIAHALEKEGFSAVHPDEEVPVVDRAWSAGAAAVVACIGMNGDDTWASIERLKADSRTRMLPIVVAAPEHVESHALRELARRQGCDAFVPTGITPEALSRILRNVIYRRPRPPVF